MLEKRYRVVYERDESKHWIATVPSVKGCHTYGRSINEARTRIREALALFVDDAETAELVDDIKLPAAARKVIVQQQRARQLAEREQDKATAVIAKAVVLLTGSFGLSARDAGEVLGLSHQRIQQVSATAQSRRSAS